MTQPPNTSSTDKARADKWPMMGALAGLLIGVFDTVSLTWIGVDMRIDGESVFGPVMLLFGASFALFGYVIGVMAQLRRKSRLDAATIRAQMVELERNRRELIESEKLATLGRMAAGVAHEVRNPLGVMRSSASLLAEELPEDAEEQRRVCLFIREEVDRLEAFVSAILQYARPIQADTEKVQLAEIVASAKRLGREHLGDRKVTMSGDGMVEADTDLLVPLVLGLLVNAAEATEDDGCVDVAIAPMADRVDLSVAAWITGASTARTSTCAASSNATGESPTPSPSPTRCAPSSTSPNAPRQATRLCC